MNPPGRGIQSRKIQSKQPRWRAKFVLSIIVSVALLSGIGTWSTQNYLWRLPASHDNSHPRALVMDQLSLNYPDPLFVTNVTKYLTGAGYSVDYSGPSPTAVDSFRLLPEQGYDLVIIRAHEGSSQAIITTESYSRSEYVADQLGGSLVPAQVANGPIYFALTPKFVRENMVGRFPGSTIIVMGCAALQGTQDMATAFLDKGANFFVGWDGLVSIIHSDTSTVSLTRLLSNETVPEATSQAGGADPVFGAKLSYLDWNTLVQSRTNNLLSKAAVAFALATILIIGPLAVFAGPRLVYSLEHLKEAASRRRTKGSNRSSSSGRPSSPETGKPAGDG